MTTTLKLGYVRFLRCTMAPFSRKVRVVHVGTSSVTVEDCMYGHRYVVKDLSRLTVGECS